MISADAVTNSRGNIITNLDSKIEDVLGKAKALDNDSWGKREKCFFGDLTHLDKWSLLSEMIKRFHGEKIPQRTKCVRFTTSAHYNKVEIGGFSYIQRKQSMSRSKLK